MPFQIPLISKICATIVILIALLILVETLFWKGAQDRPYRNRRLLLALSCMMWGGLVWLPVLPFLAEVAAANRNVIHLARLFCLVLGGWVFIILYKAGQLNLRKRKPGT
jgi:nitric oxide reductase large subunit